MNLLFKISKIYIPSYLKKKELMNLFQITAAAFKTTVPPITNLSFEECLAEYAYFTKAEVEHLIAQNGEMQTIQDRLYRGAYKFGETMRKRYHVSTVNDVMATSRLLYRILGIDFQGTEQGTIMITQCYFSRTYSSLTCRIISSLDAGMIAGLSGGGVMVFSGRITEGFNACQAQFTLKERLQ